MMVEDMMCDPALAPNFKGFYAVSAVFPLYPNSGAAARCPYPASGHHDFSFFYFWGTNDTSYYVDTTSYLTGKQNTGCDTCPSYFPAQAAMLTDLINPWLGCSNKPTVTHPDAHWTLSTYTRCTNPNVATGIIIGNNEGHSWPGFHNFGENDAQEVWDTFVAHHPAS